MTVPPGPNARLGEGALRDSLPRQRCPAYEDGETGEVVLFLNRLFERGGWKSLGWHGTDLYRCRISLD